MPGHAPSGWPTTSGSTPASTEQLQERCLHQQEADHIFHLAVYARVSRNGVVWSWPLRRWSGFARNGRTSWCTCSAIHARRGQGILSDQPRGDRCRTTRQLYRFCDVGISPATNYSLIPQEMMGSGLPVVDLAVESTEAIYPEGGDYPGTRQRRRAGTASIPCWSPQGHAGASEAALDWVGPVQLGESRRASSRPCWSDWANWMAP